MPESEVLPYLFSNTPLAAIDPATVRHAGPTDDAVSLGHGARTHSDRPTAV
jgi:hypothetical protein